ncbi:MAG: hypothetical protein M1834_006469 [Cirrosporium novae-zelandiae]|nr:MAG: hypothetical protein M1834_006469 [Cirrosporium novae-zelandiae]
MRLSLRPATFLFALLLLLPLIAAWSPQDHEIFRLHDEVLVAEGSDATFYSFLGVPPTASLEDINKAYRKQSRKIHPDKAKQAFISSYSKSKSKSGSKKNKKPGVHVSKPPSQREIQAAVKTANERFTRLGLVTKILRGPLRDRYDHFLNNGFPIWRGTGYYYARFRPGLGSVLLGLFIVGGGAVHYTVLVLGWRQRREFVDRYIKRARRSAWGDETGIRGIGDFTGGGASVPSAGIESQEQQQPALTRKQRREMERQAVKDRKKASHKGQPEKEESFTPPPGRVENMGTKKRVVAENGKVLIVDAVGNVYLEDTDEDGNIGEYLLDPDELPKPTIKDTALVRLPVWVWRSSMGKVLGTKKAGEELTEEEETEEDSSNEGGINTPPSSEETSEETELLNTISAEKKSDNSNAIRKRANKKAGKRQKK